MAGLANRMATLVAFTVAAISATGTQTGQHTDLPVEGEVWECPNADSGAAELLVVQPCCRGESAQPCILPLTDAVSGANNDPNSPVQSADHVGSQVSASDSVLPEHAVRTSLVPYGEG